MIFSRRKTIGVFISKMFRVFDDAVFRALERESKRLDYDIVVFMTVGYYLTQSDYDIQEKNIFRLAAIDRLDGIIIVPDSYDEGEFRDLLFDMLRRHAQCPVVAIRHISDTCDCVYTDESEAIRPLVRHLIEDHGARKICFQKGAPTSGPDANKRLAAFRAEMAAHGLPVPDSAVCPGTMWTNCGQQAYDSFFSDPNDWPDAVVCANDYMALGLMRTLKEHGIRTPEDVIVTGFDCIPFLGLDEPSLTTVKPDYERMVVEAMDHLDRQIRGGVRRQGQTRVRLPGIFVKGESCGCGRRHPDYFRQASRDMMKQLEAENDQDARINNMCIDVGACDDLAELHRLLVSKRVANEIVRDHYLCLFGEPDNLMCEAGNRACLVHAVRDRQDCGMPMISFDRGSLLPPMAERPDEPQVFFVKLLHQKGHNFGYNVIQYVAGEAPSRAYVQRNVLVAIALENIYRRREMTRLYEERRLSSITDMMTGLLNRRGLVERLESAWPDYIGREIAFVCVDLDRLKHINDTYGHAAGDFAIRLVAQGIQRSMPRDALGARIGGDEFVVFLPEAGDGGAERFVQRFECALVQLNGEEQRAFPVTASAGFAVKRLGALDTIEKCMQASDHEMYRVKAARRAARTD